MPELSDHYLRVREYAERFSLDESTVYKMIERGEIRAIRIGKKALRIPSSELERFLDRRPEPGGASDPEPARRVASFKERTGHDPHDFVRRWRAGEIEDTPEKAQIAIEALALRAAIDREHAVAA